MAFAPTFIPHPIIWHGCQRWNQIRLMRLCLGLSLAAFTRHYEKQPGQPTDLALWGFLAFTANSKFMRFCYWPRHHDEEVQAIPRISKVTLLPKDPQSHHLDDHLHRKESENEVVKCLETSKRLLQSVLLCSLIRERESRDTSAPAAEALPIPWQTLQGKALVPKCHLLNSEIKSAVPDGWWQPLSTAWEALAAPINLRTKIQGHHCCTGWIFFLAFKAYAFNTSLWLGLWGLSNLQWKLRFQTGQLISPRKNLSHLTRGDVLHLWCLTGLPKGPGSYPETQTQLGVNMPLKQKLKQ